MLSQPCLRKINVVFVYTSSRVKRAGGSLCKMGFFGWCLRFVLVFALTGCGGASDSLTGGGGQEADPVAVDFPIAYVARSLPVDEDGNPAEEDILDPAMFNAGAELFMRARASSEAPEMNITAGLFEEGALYDVKDVSVSYDGRRLLFALRAPELDNVDDDDQPTWNIWEYDSETRELRRVIRDDNTAEVGQDVSPRYTASGRILFSSTRQRRARAILLDENKPQYEAQDEDLDRDAFNLHTMASDGTDIQQISFNQSHDLYPSLMADGRVLFLRWDNVNNNNTLSFYTVNPDGSGLNYLYGLHSQERVGDGQITAYWSPQLMADGRVLTLFRPRENQQYGGDLLAIDTENYYESNQQTISAVSGVSQGQESLSVAQVNIDGSASPHGTFASAWPLFDGTERLFVSWSLCRLNDAALTEVLPCTEDNINSVGVLPAEPLYGLWMYDVLAETQQPIVLPQPNLMYTDAVVLEARETPDFIPSVVPDVELEAASTALLSIRSVYDFDGVDTTPDGIEALRDPLLTPPDARPARFLRIEKAVSIPDDDTLDFDRSAFGVNRRQLMREIVGYVPIEPDGSVVVQVPADIAISLSVLDARGRRITQRHENWLHFTTGDTIACNGCHTAASEVAHGRADTEPVSVNAGAQALTLPFLNTDPALFTDVLGETMAEVWRRINGPRELTMDIVFDDDWTDPAITVPAESFRLSYLELLTPAPATNACITDWNGLCRTVINYLEHIQPLWELDRPVLDDAGLEIENQRCTSCHSEFDEVQGIAQIPAAQLDLSSAQSPDNPDYAISYQELFVQNDRQILDDTGTLIFELIETGEFVTDADGEFVLDENGDPIPILERVDVNAILRTAGANASSAFFQIFELVNAVHADYLTPAELRLISEWLDLGGQYYNNPFDAPLN